MKNLKYYLSVCLLACSTMASAQFANSGSNSTIGTTTTSTAETWSGLRVSYKPITMEMDDEEEDMTAFSIDYVFSFKLSETTPLFLETGIGYQYASWDESYDEESMEIMLHSLNIPLNVGYKHQFNNDISIMPFAGINLRGNLVGNMVYEDDYYDEEEEVDLFDDDDMDDPWKRFQIGWQIGVGLNFNKFYAGISYGGDFSEIADEVKLKSTSITVGLNF